MNEREEDVFEDGFGSLTNPNPVRALIAARQAKRLGLPGECGESTGQPIESMDYATRQAEADRNTQYMREQALGRAGANIHQPRPDQTNNN